MDHPPNLSTSERAASGVLAAILSVMARRAHPLVRAGAVIAGLALLTRAVTGRCSIKAALMGTHPLGVSGTSTDAIDESVEGSFPASDPPSSHLPDEPPSNADDKWQAARAAGKAPS
jgi:hypothetical protein